jgi:hypothetical protein
MDTSSALEHPDSRYFEAMEPAGLEPATSCLQSAPTMSRRVAPCPAVSDIYPGTAGTARERGSAAAQPCGRSLPRRLPRARGQSCAKHRSALPDQPRIAHRRSPCAGPRQRPTAAAGAASPLRTHNRPRVAVAASTYGCSPGTSRSTFARAVAVSVPGAARTAHASVRSRGTIARCGSLCSRLPSP